MLPKISSGQFCKEIQIWDVLLGTSDTFKNKRLFRDVRNSVFSIVLKFSFFKFFGLSHFQSSHCLVSVFFPNWLKSELGWTLQLNPWILMIWAQLSVAKDICSFCWLAYKGAGILLTKVVQKLYYFSRAVIHTQQYRSIPFSLKSSGL